MDEDGDHRTHNSETHTKGGTNIRKEKGILMRRQSTSERMKRALRGYGRTNCTPCYGLGSIGDLLAYNTLDESSRSHNALPKDQGGVGAVHILTGGSKVQKQTAYEKNITHKEEGYQCQYRSIGESKTGSFVSGKVTGKRSATETSDSHSLGWGLKTIAGNHRQFALAPRHIGL